MSPHFHPRLETGPPHVTPFCERLRRALSDPGIPRTVQGDGNPKSEQCTLPFVRLYIKHPEPGVVGQFGIDFTHL
jgi:hypothetical protein